MQCAGGSGEQWSEWREGGGTLQRDSRPAGAAQRAQGPRRSNINGDGGGVRDLRRRAHPAKTRPQVATRHCQQWQRRADHEAPQWHSDAPSCARQSTAAFGRLAAQGQAAR